MLKRASVTSALLLLFSVAAISTLGCSGGDVSGEVPTDEVAIASLKAALTAWQAGSFQGGIANVEPNVNFVDNVRDKNKKLLTFEVLGKVEGAANLQYNTKLTMEGESAPTEVKYIIMGKSPVWVYREEDYKK